MRHRTTYLSSAAFLFAIAGLCSAVFAQTDISPYLGIDVSSMGLEGLFGPKVQELNVVQDRPTFSFGTGAFKDANMITMVFQADAPVTLGGGLTLNVGDYTFAYLIDLTNNPFTPDGSLNDLQLNALVSDYINPSPADLIALSEIKGAGYSTNIEFGPHNAGYPQSYPVSAEMQDWGGFANNVEYDWPTEYPGDPSKSGYLQPGDMGLVFLFTTPDIVIMEIGEGAGDEGALMIGGGAGAVVEYIPVLVPTVPEPTILLISGFLAIFGLSQPRRSSRR